MVVMTEAEEFSKQQLRGLVQEMIDAWKEFSSAMQLHDESEISNQRMLKASTRFDAAMHVASEVLRKKADA